MRLKERQLLEVEIARRVCKTGALGSVTEAFSEEKIRVRASVLPESGAYSVQDGGLKSGKGLRIIVPKDTPVSDGDGVWLDGEMYVVSSVHAWRAHTELDCAHRA